MQKTLNDIEKAEWILAGRCKECGGTPRNHHIGFFFACYPDLCYNCADAEESVRLIKALDKIKYERK